MDAARGGYSRKSSGRGAVRLVLDEGKTVGSGARDLDLTPSALANWVKQARADRTKGKLERDILKKATS